LRYVYLADGTWVNGALVPEGYAQVTIYPPDPCYEEWLYRLQALAQAEQVGGWGPAGGSDLQMTICWQAVILFRIDGPS